MHSVGQEPRIELCPNQIDHVAAWLDRRSAFEAWGMVLVSMALVAGLDFSTEAFELCIATLYILPICLAAWMFPMREAIGITVLVTGTALLKYPLLHTDPSVFTTIYNGTARILAFALLTLLMRAFRRSYDHAQLAASRDWATGLLNKIAFHERTSGLLDVAHVGNRAVLLLYIDLDGFKNVNDRYGHQAGDAVLQSFAAEAARALRRGDCFGRLGGDEFGVAIVVQDGDEPERLAKSLHQHFTRALDLSGYGVTCSTGALIVPAATRSSCIALVEAADRLMYSSKQSGKNTVTIKIAEPSGDILDPIARHSRDLQRQERKISRFARASA